jgi:hypothetical protein
MRALGHRSSSVIVQAPREGLSSGGPGPRVRWAAAGRTSQKNSLPRRPQNQLIQEGSPWSLPVMSSLSSVSESDTRSTASGWVGSGGTGGGLGVGVGGRGGCSKQQVGGRARCPGGALECLRQQAVHGNYRTCGAGIAVGPGCARPLAVRAERPRTWERFCIGARRPFSAGTPGADWRPLAIRRRAAGARLGPRRALAARRRCASCQAPRWAPRRPLQPLSAPAGSLLRFGGGKRAQAVLYRPGPRLTASADVLSGRSQI